MAFRQAVYDALGARRDALCDVLDALLTSGPVPSLAHLSLAAVHRRGHGSLYAALAHGQMDVGALRPLIAAHPLEAGALVYGIDASVWPRPAAQTSADRGFPHHAHRAARPVGGHPIVAGWSYQWISWISPLHLTRDSWTAPLEVARVRPHEHANALAVTQIVRVLRLRPPAPAEPSRLFVLDAGFDSVQLVLGLEAARGVPLEQSPVALVVRVRADRCFYADPAPMGPGTAGRPPRHGRRFACPEPATWGTPTATSTTTDPVYGTVQVQVQAQAWAGLHGIPRDHAGRGRRDHRGLVPLVRGTLLRVAVSRLPGRTGAPQPLGLWWKGAGQPDLELLWRAYVRRFDREHPFRFFKQPRLWTTPRLRTPEQADRWTWLVRLAYTQVRLAQPLAADQRLPWEQPLPPAALTPGRVRRAFSAVPAQVGTPAHAAQPCGRSPGRPQGRRSPPAPRYPVVKKTPKTIPKAG